VIQERKFYQVKIEAGVYDYRGFEIWKNAVIKQWIVNGRRGGYFDKLSEAKHHVDQTIKYAKKL
jgi:hypothetical protein